MKRAKRAKPRVLRIRVDAYSDYAKLLSAISNWREGTPLRPTEELLVRSICEDVAKGHDPTIRFFESVVGQPGTYRPFLIALDYLTVGGRDRAKKVGKRWNLAPQRVRNIAGKHKAAAAEFIEGITASDARAFVEHMLSVDLPTTH